MQQSVDTIFDDVDAFLDGYVSVSGIDVLTAISDAKLQLDAVSTDVFEMDSISEMSTAVNEAVGSLTPLFNYVKFVLDKSLCCNLDPETGGVPAAAVKTAACEAVAQYVKSPAASLSGTAFATSSSSTSFSSSSFSSLSSHSNAEIQLTDIFDSPKSFNPTSTNTTTFIEVFVDSTSTAATKSKQIRDTLDNSLADLDDQFDKDAMKAPLDDVRGYIDMAEDFLNDADVNMVASVEEQMGAVVSVDNPIAQFKTMFAETVQPHKSYISLGSYALGGTFLLICVMYLLELLTMFICPNSCCFCCCQCVNFFYFIVVGLILVVFGIIGIVFREGQQFIYTSDLTDLLKKPELSSFIMDNIPEVQIPDQRFSLGTVNISLQDLIAVKDDVTVASASYYLYDYSVEGSPFPLQDGIDGIRSVLIDLFHDVYEINSSSILNEDVTVGPQLMTQIRGSATALNNSANSVFDDVTSLLSASVVSRMLFTVLDLPMRTMTNTMMLFWVSGFFLYVLVYIHICCLGSGRTYWPRRKLAITPAGSSSSSGDEGEALDGSKKGKSKRRHRTHTIEMEEQQTGIVMESNSYKSEYDTNPSHANDQPTFGTSGIMLVPSSAAPGSLGGQEKMEGMGYYQQQMSMLQPASYRPPEEFPPLHELPQESTSAPPEHLTTFQENAPKPQEPRVITEKEVEMMPMGESLNEAVERSNTFTDYPQTEADLPATGSPRSANAETENAVDS